MKYMAFLTPYLQKIKTFALAHKILSGIAAILIVSLGWWSYSAATSTSGQVRYVLGTVASSTIISTVSESGQVSATNSIDIKPQVSGQITWVAVKAGAKVRAGQAIASIDHTTATQSLQAAENQLATDKLNFQKDSAAAPLNYQNDQAAVTNAQSTLQNDYNTVYNDLSSVFLDLPTVMNGAQDTLYGYEFDARKNQWNKDALFNIFNPTYQDITDVQSFQTKSLSDYTTAKTAYTNTLSAYKNLVRTASNDSMDSMLAQAITMQTAVAQALQSQVNFLGAASDLAQKNNIALPSNFSTVQTNARTYLSTANSDLTKLLSDKKMLDSDKQSLASAKQNVTLDQVGNDSSGSNPISLQVEANNIAKEEQDIANQKANLAKYTIVAPFDGIISAVTAQVGDTAGSAAVATIVSNSQIADLSVNEVDATKIKLGDKAILTFDAIDDLSLTGTVAEIDSVGTVSQGVVSYKVQISFDSQDPRIKAGMTINADIQTDVVHDALVVPSSAIKTVGGNTYVQVFDPPLADTGDAQGVVSATAPTMIPVVTGVSDDTNIQILSGLNVGQQVVVSTRASKTTTSAANTATNRTGAGTTGARNATFGPAGGATVIRSF